MSNFIEYRKNKKIAKRELAQMMATTLPTFNKIASGASDIADWFWKLIDSTHYVTSDHVLDYTIEQLAQALGSNSSRLKEMTSYILSMPSQDIVRIISAAAMETNKDIHPDETEEEDRE